LRTFLWLPLTALAVKVSFVIPTLNEAGQLPLTLASLPSLGGDFECCIADGGSLDSSRDQALHAGARWIECAEPGRGKQLNAGAFQAQGDVLVFLHADTRMLPGALHSMLSALGDKRLVGGAFQRRFNHPSRFLRATCWLADARAESWGWFFGDQCQFVRREVFLQLGGYVDWPLFEDLDFSRRLARIGKTCLIRPGVISSGRRFGDQPVRRTLKDFGLTLRYWTGGAQGTGTNTAR